MVDHVLAVFAVYRVSRMVTRENGPFGVFFYGRARVRSAIEGRGALARWGWIVEGAHCGLCLSVWIGFALAIMAHVPAWYGLAYSGAAVWLLRNERPES